MKKLIVSLCIIGLMSTYAFAQPQSGLKLSTNTTFIKSTNEYNYKPLMGLGIGYEHAFRFTDSWHLTLGVGYNLSSVMINDKTYEDYEYYEGGNNNRKSSEESLAIPIAINYTYNKFSAKLGYQYAYVSDISIFATGGGGFGIDPHSHSIVMGLGYNFGFMSCSLDYLHGLNRTLSSSSAYGNPYFGGNSEYLVQTKETFKTNTIQLSVTIPLSKKKSK
ncbi:outer membrane protein [Saccharicrinis aurantiacus]|uniref:outer membrane protein n=1 Tax=Saccharicrinis aurantiacus TaxID=1849719 RepID=UPI0011151D79|nr:TonB-dependent receptor [Saccharicrinis aurantiacus]